MVIAFDLERERERALFDKSIQCFATFHVSLDGEGLLL